MAAAERLNIRAAYKDLAMVNSCIIAPLPQFAVKKTKAYEFPFGFVIGSLSPTLRRGLLNAAQAHKCSEKTLGVLVESECVCVAQVPDAWPAKSGPLVSGTFYKAVANAVLKRLVDAFRLWGDVPDVFELPCWFAATGTPTAVDVSSIVPTESDWGDYAAFYETGCPVQLSLEMSQRYWEKIKSLLQIDMLIRTYTDEEKQKGYMRAGNARIREEAEKLVRLHWARTRTAGPMKFQGQLTAGWCLQGWLQAYSREIGKLNRRQYEDRPERRLSRSFQVFTSAFRMRNPFRYTAFITCLESLLSLGTGELTFQLASRSAWLLHPDDPKERLRTFQTIRDCYGLRSKIVHGAVYRVRDLEAKEEAIVDITRSVFARILLDERLHDVFTGKDQTACDGFLKYLCIGHIP